MKSSKVHYEVLGQRGNSWTILAVIDDQTSALDKAREAQASYRAVKVMRERFDEENNTYRSGQIFYAGPQSKASKFDQDEVPSVCWKVEDFYSYEGRRAINRLLKKELTEWGLTATELLHSPEMVQRLQDNGTSVQRAVQQTAIVQVRETGQGVQERIKQIYELIDKGAKALTRDAAGFPCIAEGGLDRLIDDVGHKESRTYLLNGAMADCLREASNFNDKLTVILDMIRAGHPDWVHQVSDSLVAELLSTGKVLGALIGARANLSAEIEAVADLAQGKTPPEDEKTPRTAHLVNELILAGKMPSTQQALSRYLIEAMKSNRRLVEGDTLTEAAAMTRLARRLRRGDGSWLGGVAMAEAVGRRCGRWVNPEAIAELLNGVSEPDDRFTRLVRLSRDLVGNANKRKLGEFVLPIISSPQGEVFLTLEGGTVTTRLKRLREMQDQVLNSGLPDTHRKKLAEKLDELCVRVLRSAQLIERMTQDRGSAVERCLGLLRMTVDGFFTRGKADAMARDAIRRSLAHPEFASGFLSQVESRNGKIQKLEALSKLLRQAGIEVQDTADTNEAEAVDAEAARATA